MTQAKLEKYGIPISPSVKIKEHPLLIAMKKKRERDGEREIGAFMHKGGPGLKGLKKTKKG